MRTKNIIAGLQILLLYYENKDGFKNGAEHDILYAYPTQTPLSKQDIQKMVDLEWAQNESLSREFKVSDYDVNETWYCRP